MYAPPAASNDELPEHLRELLVNAFGAGGSRRAGDMRQLAKAGLVRRRPKREWAPPGASPWQMTTKGQRIYLSHGDEQRRRLHRGARRRAG